MNPLPATLTEAYQAIHEADAHARAAEVALIIGIAKAAELYEVDDAAVMDAVEGLLEPGEDGTPSVGEFLAHELAGILQISPDAALEKIGTVREGARMGGIVARTGTVTSWQGGRRRAHWIVRSRRTTQPGGTPGRPQ